MLGLDGLGRASTICVEVRGDPITNVLFGDHPHCVICVALLFVSNDARPGTRPGTGSPL